MLDISNGKCLLNNVEDVKLLSGLEIFGYIPIQLWL
jgi:hypothetical protein